MGTNIQFLGAARTVTGSKHVISHRGKVIMLDCGMFQGLKKWRLKNWGAFPLPSGYVDDIILSHAHLDHTGFLPRFYKMGYAGKVFATPSTADLCNILLQDSAHIQEEDARYANKEGFSKHSPALPLYTKEDVEDVLGAFQVIPYNHKKSINKNISFEYFDAGHILGSAIVHLRLKREDNTEFTIVFSGDLGRYGEHILKDPTPIEEADFLIIESTYGNRLHTKGDAELELGEIINKTARRGGIVIIPSFAVGRTQEILYHIKHLQETKQIPMIPVFADSPLAIKATAIFCNHPENHRLEIQDHKHPEQCPVLCHNLHLASKVTESIAINSVTEPCIIISASGMAEAGRILHHLKLKLPDSRNSLVFVGYQAEGTRGRRILDGEKEIKIHGQYIPVRAEIHRIDTFSAHADYNEILKWLGRFKRKPLMTFIVHGEEKAMESLREKISTHLGWPTYMPEYLEKIDLENYLPPLSV